MAKSNKSKSNSKGGLKQIFPRDKEFFSNIRNTGVVTPQNYKNAGVSSSRIKTYAKAGLIEKTPKENRGAFGYKLTSEGKDFMERTWGMERAENYSFQSLNHDRKLEEEYYKIDHSQYEWKTESQARDMFQQKIDEIREQDPNRADEIQRLWDNKEISMPDAMIINRTTGVVTAIEVVTNSYGQQELQAKETFVEIMEVEYKPVHA